MTAFDKSFTDAFNDAMLYEVGKFWNPADPEVISGAYATKDQKRKVGYVNIPADRGGETKYGIAQKANPSVAVASLNLEKAMQVYYSQYWLAGSNDKLPYPLNIIHFDGCVNHGIGRACKFLQQAASVTADGQIGSMTISAINKMDQKELINKLSKIRSDFYAAIVARDPSQKIFLNGWNSRITEVTKFTLSKI